MSLEAFYESAGGNLADVRARFLTDERIQKFLVYFFQDTSYDDLRAALTAGNSEEAFRAAHTLKGVSRDMGFTDLGEAASSVTEALRPASDGTPQPTSAADPLLPELERVHLRIMTAAAEHPPAPVN